MVELKTLKDFKCDYCGEEKHSEDTKLIEVMVLRQEAIKRVKFIQEIFLDGVEMDKSPTKTQREAYFHQKGKIDELVRFFNLSKPDLNLVEKYDSKIIHPESITKITDGDTI